MQMKKILLPNKHKDMLGHCLTESQGCATFMTVSFHSSVRDIVSETFYTLDVQLVYFSFYLGLHRFWTTSLKRKNSLE